MFCPKCGMKALDGATFCQKCGAQLITDSAAQQSAASMLVQQTPPSTHNVPSDTPKKKNSKKLPIIIGIIAVVIAAVIFIALNWEGKTDYEATVRAYTPFANSQGLPYTCGEVFDKYIPNAKWKIRQSGDVTYVDISGTAKGTEKELVVTIKVAVDSSDPDIANMSPVSVKVDGRKTSTQKETEMVFFTLFVAYDEKYDDLSNFAELGSEIEAALQGEVSLTETYMNETEGFSFRYPSGMKFNDMADYGVKDASGFSGVCIFANDASNSPYSSMTVLKNSNPQFVESVFSDDSKFLTTFRYNFDAYSKLETSIGELDGMSVRMINYVIDEKIANQVYIYVNDSSLYQVIFACPKDEIENQEKIFNAIMESYTITAADTSGETVSSGADAFGNVLNEYISSINDAAYTNCAYVLYDIDGNGVDELLVRYEDMMDEYTNIYTYVDGTTYKIGEFWSRNRLLLDEDGNFYIIGSNDAANTTLELARISSNGTDLVTTETWEMNGSIFTHTSPNGDEVISEREYQIASDRFFNITTDFVDSLNWQSLSAMAGNGTLDNSDSAGATTNDTAGTTDQVLFCGIPVQDVIGMTANEVTATFGEPESHTEDVIDYGSDTPNRMHFGIMNENTVYGLSASPACFTFNGQSLNQNFDTMVTILGDTYIEQGSSTYDFEIAWYYEGCQISFRFPAYPNEADGDKVIEVSVYPIG